MNLLCTVCAGKLLGNGSVLLSPCGKENTFEETSAELSILSRKLTSSAVRTRNNESKVN